MDINLALQKRWLDFWYTEATRSWFLERGYRLFTPIFVSEEEIFDEELEAAPFQKSPYPYPHYSEELDHKELISSRRYARGAVAFGIDSQLQPIVVKFVEGDSEEHKCLQFIHSLDSKQSQDACLLPVLGFLECGDHWFAIMPQWSTVDPEGNCLKLQDALVLIRSMLLSLEFLHKHKIFHRDIKFDNSVFNFLPANVMGWYPNDPVYASLQSNKQLCYAMIDFGLAIMFPESSSPQQCRLPYRESWCGTISVPDTMQGEFDFDPFAYDVGLLGIEFASTFQHLTPHAPMLAPLVDQMVTRDIQTRFTAAQALQFFDMMYTELTQDQLLTDISYYRRCREHYEAHDRWTGLPSAFIEKWSKYREPALPRSTKILRSICISYPRIYRSVAFMGRIFRPIIRFLFST